MIEQAVIKHPADVLGADLVLSSALCLYSLLQNPRESQFFLEMVYVRLLHFEQYLSDQLGVTLHLLNPPLTDGTSPAANP